MWILSIHKYIGELTLLIYQTDISLLWPYISNCKYSISRRKSIHSFVNLLRFLFFFLFVLFFFYKIWKKNKQRQTPLWNTIVIKNKLEIASQMWRMGCVRTISDFVSIQFLVLELLHSCEKMQEKNLLRSNTLNSIIRGIMWLYLK